VKIEYITIRVTPDFKRLLRSLAASEGRSMTAQIEHIVLCYASANHPDIATDLSDARRFRQSAAVLLR
jgi:uncharacterized protein (DUF1778 family)